MTPRRAATVGAALAVAAIAAVASYSHMRHLAIQYGQDHLIASSLPISVDGMLVVATLALGDGRRYRWSAWMTFGLGVGVSIAANALAAPPSTLARFISAWPAVAFLATVEVITRGGRGQRVSMGARTPQPVPAPVEDPQVTAPIIDPPSVLEMPPAEPARPAPKVKSDAQILAALRNPKRVPRDPDGTIPIQRAAKTLGCGTDRARKLLDQAGLLRTDDERLGATHVAASDRGANDIGPSVGAVPEGVSA